MPRYVLLGVLYLYSSCFCCSFWYNDWGYGRLSCWAFFDDMISLMYYVSETISKLGITECSASLLPLLCDTAMWWALKSRLVARESAVDHPSSGHISLLVFPTASPTPNVTLSFELLFLLRTQLKASRLTSSTPIRRYSPLAADFEAQSRLTFFPASALNVNSIHFNLTSSSDTRVLPPPLLLQCSTHIQLNTDQHVRINRHSQA